jgi:hypothetical protein
MSEDKAAEVAKQTEGGWLPLPVDNITDALPFLRRPFAPGAVKWKVQSTWPKGKPAEGAIVVGYIDARLVSERLNMVVGGNWSEKPVRVGDRPDALMYELTVFDTTHVDVGISQGATEGMKLKGAHSDALKRTAVRFGVGVPLYAMPEVRIPVTPDGAEASDGTPTIKRRGDGKAGYLSQGVEAFLRQRYENWLKGEGNTFGAPLDHGDASVGSVGYEDPDAADESGTGRPEPEPMADAEGTELIAQAEALRDEIQALDPSALGSFDNALKQRWHAADLMRDFIGKLEGLRGDIERFLALQEEAVGKLGEDAAKKAVEKAMRRGSRSERVEVLEKALAENGGDNA